MKKSDKAIKLKTFDPRAENEFYESSPTIPPTLKDLDKLAFDMQLWIPEPSDKFVNKRVLDLGAGTAPVGTVISHRFSPAAVVSLELVLHRIRTATIWVKKLDTLKLVCGDIFSLPFEDCSFDYVIANSVLHHLPRPGQAIAEISRVMCPGGQYLGREPNFNNPFVRFGVFHLCKPLLNGATTPNEYPLRAEEIITHFSKAGCDCKMHYFWRRLPKLRHPLLSIAMSVRAQRRV